MTFQPHEKTEPPPAGPAPQVLLVEDNAADVGLVREALMEHNVRCELTVIVNGERAIKFFDEADAGEHPWPDLVILDLNLPKKPGKDVLRRIRASPSCPSVPVIILTSSDSQKDRDDVANLNPSRYIRKPSRLEEFLKLGGVFKESLYPAD